MTGLRQDIYNQAVRDDFLEGVVRLDQERSGISSSDLGNFLRNNQIPLAFRGIDQELSTYDLFVFWHVVAMRFPFPPGNAAHSGPIFLPWHRMYLIRLEQELQRVLRDSDFGLPYWDWALDGMISPLSQQWQTDLWRASALGESRGQVRSGALADLEVRIEMVGNTLWSVRPRRLERQAGRDIPSLPDLSDVANALSEAVYDRAPWGLSARGHRNRLEGWLNGPQLHNRVHVWVGGDMGPGSSPNDPVFFLNHCNVDRIWEAWMARAGRQYQPRNNQGPRGHRLGDSMIAILGESLRPADVLDPFEWYGYDSLAVS